VKRLYLAAPLFSASELAFNSRLTLALEEYFDVFLPQRDGGLLTNLLEAGVPPDQAKREIFDRDVAAIIDADLILAVLDGRSIDEGVAVEIGMAFAFNKLCWGLKTDVRSLAPFGDNPMVVVPLSRVFRSVDDLIGHLRTTSSAVELH
jgi:nucleoside 2-deoxyribosyltransferase